MNVSLLIQLTTIADFIVYALVAWFYLYLKRKSSPLVAGSYTYLTLAWISIAGSVLPGIIRTMLPPTMPHAHICWLKISMIAGAFAFAWFYMFLGNLYQKPHLQYFFYLLGWLVTVPLYLLSVLQPGYAVAVTSASIEVLLPPSASFITVFGWLLLLGSFAFTAIYFQYQPIQKILKTKILHVCLTCTIFWICYLGEALGLVFSLLGSIGIILIRTCLAIMAIHTIFIWAVTTNIIKAFTSNSPHTPSSR